MHLLHKFFIVNVLMFSFIEINKSTKFINRRHSRNKTKKIWKQYNNVFVQQKAMLQQMKHEKYIMLNKSNLNDDQNEPQKLNIGVFSMGLLNLEPWQIKCAVNVLFGSVSSPNHYGCYCGKGNLMDNGHPTDEIDSICQVHDQCYLDCDKISNCVLKTGATYKWAKDARKKVRKQTIR